MIVESCDSFFFFLSQTSKDVRDLMIGASNVLAIVGAWYTLRFTVKIGSWLIACVKCAGLRLKKINYIKSYGNWAAVTGCTSGIGRAFVRNLAAKGLNIILISRNEEALKEEAKYLENAYGIHTIVVVQDFKCISSNSIENIKDLFNKLEVGILINNVGVHYAYPMQFDQVTDEVIHSLVQVNVRSTVALTHAILPGMIQRQRGLVVNMSSGAGLSPIPLITLYSACKAFIDHFSQSLYQEMLQHNIHIQSLTPMYVATEMTSYSTLLNKSRIFTPTPETYVKHAMLTLGYYKVNTGYFPHTIQTWLLTVSPHFLSMRISYWLQQKLNHEGSTCTKKDN